MGDYQLIANSTNILRTSDGAFITADGGNVDYQNYLVWVAAGNTADPISTPAEPPSITLADLQSQLTALTAQIQNLTGGS